LSNLFVLQRPLLLFILCFVAATAIADNLRVGAARIEITPPADPAHPPTGKYAHAHLYVRAIVLDNGSARAALIGADQAGQIAKTNSSAGSSLVRQHMLTGKGAF
jgi:hypothetical protein